MPISDALLKILVCPEDKTAVHLAESQLVERLNKGIAAGQIKNRGGNIVTEKMDGALVRKDNRVAYPIRQDIPIMLVDEGIELMQLEAIRK